MNGLEVMLEDFVNDVARIAAALERIADVLDDVSGDGRLFVAGKIVAVEDRP